MSNGTHRVAVSLAATTVAVATFIAVFIVVLAAALLYGPAWVSLTHRYSQLGASSMVALITGLPVAVMAAAGVLRTSWDNPDQE